MVTSSGQLQNVIAALATPVGTSALAVIRVSGAGSRGLLADILGKDPPDRRACYVDYIGIDGRRLDDVVVTCFTGPRSYTGEDGFEISLHGNPLIAQSILGDLYARGCRAAEPGEFTRRAFLNGRMDLSQAEAVMDVIHARSERALHVAQQQLRGSLGRYLEALIEQLLQILAQIEAYIDFPDEDLPEENRVWVIQEVKNVLRGTSRLLATHRYGELLRDGIKTVLIGEPNVGKSSLLNCLVGRDRALVSDQPGTTRDFIEERLEVGAHMLRLIDTAGLNVSPGEIERMGIEKSVEQVENADLVLWVLDAGCPAVSLPERVKEALGRSEVIVVANKMDLLEEGRERSGALAALGFPCVAISAKAGSGVEELVRLIETKAEAFRQDLGSEVIAINARHADAMRRAQGAFESALVLLEDSGPTELLASDLRAGVDALGEIMGRVDNERMLDHLFATFCIGK